jgi:hypothetical protein
MVAVMLSCTPDENESSSTKFTKLSPEETGITFVNTNTEDERNNIVMYEYFYNGGGVAAGDINNDGWVDLYFTSNQGENKLYLNKGNFEFEDITQQAGVSCKNGWKTGVSMVDINGDGYLDIYVCRSKEDHPLKRDNWLYINNKDLTFTNKVGEYGLNDDSYSSHSAFFDFDKDGDLDAFLLNHSLLHISNSYDISARNTKARVPYVGNRFLVNNNGKFIDLSDSLGVYGPASNYGLGIAYGDINNDGWIDLYASNDYTGKDKLLLNQQGRFFQDVTDSLLTHISQFSMGVDIADINNDGYEDIFSVDMLPEGNKRQKELFWPDRYDVYAGMVKNGLHHQYMRNMLHLNNGDGSFSEIGQIAGISNTDWSWSPLFADYDLDGFQDLFVSNGYKRDVTNNDFLKYRADISLKLKQGKQIDKLSDYISRIPSTKEHNYMFSNVDGNTFKDVSGRWGFGDFSLTNGVAYADLDNDGDPDLVLNNMDDVAGIYRNNTDHDENNFLNIKLTGNDGNRFGLGTKVTLYGEGKSFTRTLCPYRGFQSSVEPTLFFGTGKMKVIDSLIVQWPRGEVQKITSVLPGQVLTVLQQNASKHEITRAESRTIFAEQKNVVKFVHRENDFIDFKVQPLLPRSYSNDGPALASADVNQDNLKDLYAGGAKGQAGALLLQQKNGTFLEKKQQAFASETASEDVDAIFFDADNDSDPDLYVVTGGYEFELNSKALQDKFFFNDGNGNFRRGKLPELNVSGSCVRPGDVDGDGDLDLFVGARITPGRYPETPESHFLLNDGKGNFLVSTDQFATTLKEIGMVTDAAWVDLNRDNKPELIVVGEWLPVMIFGNDNGELIDKTSAYLKDSPSGWWNCLKAGDFDQDGDVDFIAGNYGMNNQFKASPSRPVNMYYADFDGNGSVDRLMNYFIGDASFPLPTRDELTDQMPSFKKRFTDYASYTTATIESILKPEEIKQARVLTATTFETTYFENHGGKFSYRALPFRMQLSPVFSIETMDVNNDGKLDLIAGGNISRMPSRFGKANGNFGSVFLGDGKGGFEFSQPATTGVCVHHDIRKLIIDGNTLIIGVNNGPLCVYKLNEMQ